MNFQKLFDYKFHQKISKIAFIIFLSEFSTTFITILIFQITVTRNFYIDEDFKYFIPIVLQIFAVCSHLMLYNVITYYTKMRFEVVNEVLIMKFKLDGECKIMKKWNHMTLDSHSPTFVLKILSTIHISLNDIIKLMNNIFSLPIAFFIGYNLFGCTFSLYETYDLALLPNESLIHVGYNVAITLINLHYFFYIFITIIMSVKVIECRNETYNILKKILHGKFDEKSKMKIRLLILQIKHSRAELSCGLFNFDWMILYSVSYIHKH